MIRFVVTGFGHIGKKHAEVLLADPQAQLVAIIDTDEQKRKNVPEHIPFFSDFISFLQSGIEADVVNIATPNGLHCAHAIVALKAGFHTVIEKPMGLRVEDCEEVIRTAREMQREIFVVKQNRYSFPARWMKETIDSGNLGKIYQVHVRCFWNRDGRYYAAGGWRGTAQLDGGVLFTQFSHFIDILYWVFGDIQNIYTRLENYNHSHNTEFADSGISVFDFTREGQGSLQFSTAVWDQNMESSMTVIGEKGSFRIGGQYMEKIDYCHIQGYELTAQEEVEPPNDYGVFKGSAANHRLMIENVVRTLQGSDTATANADGGMKVVDIIQRIYEAGN